MKVDDGYLFSELTLIGYGGLNQLQNDVSQRMKRTLEFCLFLEIEIKLIMIAVT